MQNDYFWGISLALLAHIIAAFSQLFLKISARRTYKAWWRSYLNFLVITAYAMFFGTTIINVFALKRIPMTLATALGATGQIFVPVVSAIFLKEKITRERLVGMLMIVVGIIVFSLKL